MCTSSGKLLWLTGLAWYGVGGLLDLEYRDLADFFAWCSMCCSRVPKCFGHLHEEEGADACTQFLLHIYQSGDLILTNNIGSRLFMPFLI